MLQKLQITGQTVVKWFLIYSLSLTLYLTFKFETAFWIKIIRTYSKIILIFCFEIMYIYIFTNLLSCCSVNAAYEALRGLIPTEPVNRKLSKIEIIRLASSYINHLQSTLHTGKWYCSSKSESISVLNIPCHRNRSSTLPVAQMGEHPAGGS